MLLTNGISVAPQALAELAPQISSAYYYPETLGLELEKKFALYGEIYSQQPWVRTVIDKRANAVARLPVQVWDIDGDTRKMDSRSQYSRLVADPCEYMDNYSFWQWIQTTIDIYGETYLALVKDGNGMPVSMMPMHPTRVAVKRNPQDGKYEYFFQAGSGIGTELVRFQQEDVVPFKLFNPRKLERGLSRLESLRSTLYSEDSSRNATASMWANSGRPNIVMSTEKKLGPDGRKRLIEAFNQAHQGSGNAGKTLVLEDGVSATQFQLTATDMQFIEGRKLNQVEVCGVFDIAPTLVGILDHATYSNVSEQIRGFYRDSMSGPLQFVESVFNKHVGSYWRRKNEMRFALDEVLRGDPEKRGETVQKAVNSGVMTPNEGRDFMGLNRSDNPLADSLFANSALQELGKPSERITLAGQVSGETPDHVAVVPPATPVASHDNSPPTMIPAVKPPRALAAVAPSKHLRAIKGELGRGRSQDEIKRFALSLADKASDAQELIDILSAVEMALGEHARKAM